MVFLINFLWWITPLVYIHIQKYILVFSFNKLSMEIVICFLNKCFVASKVCRYIFLHPFYYINSDTTRHRFYIRKKKIKLKEYSKCVKRTNKKKEYIKFGVWNLEHIQNKMQCLRFKSHRGHSQIIWQFYLQNKIHTCIKSIIFIDSLQISIIFVYPI